MNFTLQYKNNIVTWRVVVYLPDKEQAVDLPASRRLHV